MISREHRVIVAFGATGLVATALASAFTRLDDTVLIGVLLFVGVVVPIALNSYLDSREGD
jgi:hypothetical protein